jgi:hypothetical protein
MGWGTSATPKTPTQLDNLNHIGGRDRTCHVDGQSVTRCLSVFGPAKPCIQACLHLFNETRMISQERLDRTRAGKSRCRDQSDHQPDTSLLGGLLVLQLLQVSKSAAPIIVVQQTSPSPSVLHPSSLGPLSLSLTRTLNPSLRTMKRHIRRSVLP